MLIPLSETAISINLSFCIAETFISPFELVNFIALEIRFLKTVLSIFMSAKTTIFSE
ncbi:MAG: hypothetical protein ACI93P_000542 [bacterium]|jgi:hypothetical protein